MKPPINQAHTDKPRWKPNVTVAALVCAQNRFLLVHEHTSQGLCYNQPAGHLEAGESLLQAVVRETLEETAWQVVPEALLGIYQSEPTADQRCYLRFAFICQAQNLTDHPLDAGIIAAPWLAMDEILKLQQQGLLRSAAVLRSIEDYLAGKRYPLELIHQFAPDAAPGQPPA